MISKDAMVSSKSVRFGELMAVHDWRNDDGIMLTFCGCFGVAEIWQVGEADNFSSDAFQLWMASEMLRDGRYLERIMMLRKEIGASR